MNLSIQQVIDCAAVGGSFGSNLVDAYYIKEAGLLTEKTQHDHPSLEIAHQVHEVAHALLPYLY